MGEKDEYRLGRVNGRYHVIWYEGGRRQRRSLGTDNKAQATALLGEFQRQHKFRLEGGKALDMASIYEAYVRDREAEGKTAVPRMLDAWKRLEPFFGPLAVPQITRDLCREYTDKRRKGGIGDGTIHVELGYLRAAVRFAKKEGWITSEPFIPLPRKPPPKLHHLTREEALRLIECAHVPHVRLFIVLALTTAGRASAILDLTWNRVNLQKRMIQLSNPERHRTAKGRATIPINDLAYEALKEAKAGAMTDYVIEWGGLPVKSVKKGVAAAARAAKVQCSPHVLRHTAAVHLAEDGHSMNEIAQYLGHSNPVTTFRIYARFSPDHLRKLGSSLEYDKKQKTRLAP